MIGLGVDLCEVARIERAAQKSDAFLERYYTEEERAYIKRRKGMGMQSAAAMYAAKEALLKALGVGLSGGVALREIAVCHDEGGAPRYALTGQAARRLSELGATRAHLTLTHEAGFACAVAIIE